MTKLKQDDHTGRKNYMRLNYLFPALISLAITLLSCTSPKLTRVYYKNDTDTYRLLVPKGYDREIVTGGGEYVEYRYQYPDRSVIYVTSRYPGTSEINHREVIAMQDSLRPGALTVGACIDGLCWKDRTLNDGITVGYAKVPVAKKDRYDRAIDSIELQNKQPPETK